MKTFLNPMTSAIFAALMMLAIQQGAARAVEHAPAAGEANMSLVSEQVAPASVGPLSATWCYDSYWGWYYCGY